MIKIFLKWIRDIYNLYSLIIFISILVLTTFLVIILLLVPNNVDINQIGIAIIVTIWVIAIGYLVEHFLKKHIINRPSAYSYLTTVRYELRMMGISLYNLHEDKRNAEIIKNKFISSNSKLDLFKDVNIKARKDFRFLLIDPFSEHLIHRANDEKKCVNKLRLECFKTIKRLEEILLIEPVTRENNGSNKIFEYRIYNCSPTHSFIMTDELLLIGPYLFGVAGYNSKWIRFTNFQAMQQYNNEFEEIWNNQKTKKRMNISKSILNFAINISDAEIDSFLEKEFISDETFTELFKKYSA